MNKSLKPKNWYYKILQVARRELRMNDDQYRSVLMSFGATIKGEKYSASTLNVIQLQQVLEYFKRCGFKLKYTQKSTPSKHKKAQLEKCKVLWHLLYKDGVMREPYSDKSLTQFAYRITKTNHINWATSAQLSKVIEALKSIAQRECVNVD